MEIVSVKLVVFKHPEPARWDTYASYCPATQDFCACGSSVIEVVDMFEKLLYLDLQNRLTYKNLQNYGWEVSENSAIPPIFADVYLVSETERIFEVTIKEPLIIKVDVELPRAGKTI
ncbi:hypothetical protein [Bacteroides sp. GM023]|uniref:hypothetical protein n=1 Tax=Bacteroides sp. GM023 TaxID=2723058 RepID=UPI00168AFB56|nr:hypothetical protein [Bacteroides sp. GM023]MBD3588789.1 hypothetical protein [Bacteroides sp. GM023]